MNIRRATPRDAGAIAGIHVASSKSAYHGLLPEEHLRSFTVERREAGWHDMLAVNQVAVWIADGGGRDVGWIATGASRDEDVGDETAEIWAMYVEPGAWRRGVGTALWTAAESSLVDAGYSRVTLWVFKENARARGFYSSVGFTEDVGQEKTGRRAGVEIIEVRMLRPLGAGC